jgi:Bacteriophage tail assembly protein
LTREQSKQWVAERCERFDDAYSFLLHLQSLYRPPSKLKLSEWADKYRVLSSESSAEPGQWVTDKAPYEREIMDAISDPLVPKVCGAEGSADRNN